MGLYRKNNVAVIGLIDFTDIFLHNISVYYGACIWPLCVIQISLIPEKSLERSFQNRVGTLCVAVIG